MSKMRFFMAMLVTLSAPATVAAPAFAQASSGGNGVTGSGASLSMAEWGAPEGVV